MDPRAAAVLDYWFGPEAEVGASEAWFAARMPLWFGGAPATDREIRERFEPDIVAAADGRLAAWEAEARPCLALIVLLDQFPLNIYRDLPRSFEQSALAIPIALRSIERGLDQAVRPVERVFCYLPIEHAEDLALQRLSVELFAKLASDVPADRRGPFDVFHDFAVKHLEVVERFGRFPDRNEVFGRPHTPAEAAYMAAGGPPF